MVIPGRVPDSEVVCVEWVSFEPARVIDGCEPVAVGGSGAPGPALLPHLEFAHVGAGRNAVTRWRRAWESVLSVRAIGLELG